MNQEPDRTERQLHWTYRVLRRFAYLSAATVFWAWIVFLALAGKF
jgi:hypothetical protein